MKKIYIISYISLALSFADFVHASDDNEIQRSPLSMYSARSNQRWSPQRRVGLAEVIDAAGEATAICVEATGKGVESTGRAVSSGIEATGSFVEKTGKAISSLPGTALEFIISRIPK